MLLVNKFRQIIVASTLSRLYHNMLLKLISPWLQEYCLNQFGNRKGTQAAEAVHVVRRVLEKRDLYGEETVLAKLDVGKAFDSLRHGSIIQALRARGVPERLTVICFLLLSCCNECHLFIFN